MRHRPGRRTARVLLAAAALSLCAVAAVTAQCRRKGPLDAGGESGSDWSPSLGNGKHVRAGRSEGRPGTRPSSTAARSSRSSTPTSTPASSPAQVEDAITSKQYDAFVILPQAGNVIVPQVKDAIKAGIKVVCLLSPCGSNQQSNARQIPGYVTTVGYQFAENGTDIAKAIVAACGSLIPARSRTSRASSPSRRRSSARTGSPRT